MSLQKTHVVEHQVDVTVLKSFWKKRGVKSK